MCIKSMYKGYMNKAKGGKFEDRRRGWVGPRGGHGGVKMEKTVLEQQ